MSNYNSQLQSNNIDLQTVLQTLQNKAAGGSSSGELVDYSENEDAMVTGTLSSYFNDRVTTIRDYAFAGCYRLTSASFPAVTTIGDAAFYQCMLTTASFPVCTSIGYGAFSECNITTANFPACTYLSDDAFCWCNSLATISFPKATYIGAQAFNDCAITTASFPACTSIRYAAFSPCRSLTTVSFPKVTYIASCAFEACDKLPIASFPAATSIGNYAFAYCNNLKSLYLTGSRICTLFHSNAFSSTPIGGYSASAGTYGSIYVPSLLLADYKTATNWAYYKSRFAAIENSPDWDGTYGGLASGDNLIVFSIHVLETGNALYQAEEGMTWGEWVNSDYSPDEFCINGGMLAYSTDDGVSGNYFYFGSSSEMLLASTQIMNNAAYDESAIGWDEDLEEI